MARPVVALLTDFGTRDHYVGTMKGVVLSVCSEASIVDITHDIAPQDVEAAAFELGAAYRYFPPATVFAVIVDPGVGSGRKAIAAAAGGYFFVAPDNGVLTAVFADVAPSEVVELSDRKYARPTISRTFEGRDRFAPAAGWIARGTALRALGPRVTTWRVIPLPSPQIDDGRVTGTVVRIDRFGNLITNITAAALATLAAPYVVILATGESLPIVETYSDMSSGDLCALVGSSGQLEIAVGNGSAAERLAATRGDHVVVSGRATIPGCHDEF
jgi:S-adenosyl-L-methionine hydrolase (adenosine-forming)